VPAGSDHRRRPFVARSAALVLGATAIALVACGGGSSDGAAPVTASTTTFPTVAAGRGVLRLGDDLERFTVTSCVDGPAADDTPEATQRFRLTGRGTAGTLAFTISVTRYSSNTGVGGTTLTETAALTSGTGDDAVGLEAKRTSIAGRWLDLNDRAAATALISRSGPTVEVVARFGPEGSKVGDEGIVAGHLRARCPG